MKGVEREFGREGGSKGKKDKRWEGTAWEKGRKEQGSGYLVRTPESPW